MLIWWLCAIKMQMWYGLGFLKIGMGQSWTFSLCVLNEPIGWKFKLVYNIQWSRFCSFVCWCWNWASANLPSASQTTLRPYCSSLNCPSNITQTSPSKSPTAPHPLPSSEPPAAPSSKATFRPSRSRAIMKPLSIMQTASPSNTPHSIASPSSRRKCWKCKSCISCRRSRGFGSISGWLCPSALSSPITHPTEASRLKNKSEVQWKMGRWYLFPNCCRWFQA